MNRATSMHSIWTADLMLHILEIAFIFTVVPRLSECQYEYKCVYPIYSPH